jgi:hypothetical protein
MPAFAAAGAAFLFSVLWVDLMFDIQGRRAASDPLPPDVLASLSGYYRRVTVDGAPMMYLPVVVMPLTIAAIVLEIARAEAPPWLGWASLLLAVAASGTTLFLAVPRGQRIGRAQEPPEVLSALARLVFLLHSLGAVGWMVVIVLQLSVR